MRERETRSGSQLWKSKGEKREKRETHRERYPRGKDTTVITVYFRGVIAQRRNKKWTGRFRNRAL